MKNSKIRLFVLLIGVVITLIFLMRINNLTSKNILFCPIPISTMDGRRIFVSQDLKEKNTEYKDIQFINKKYFKCKDRYSKYGVLDKDLKTIVPFEYDSIFSPGGDILCGTNNNLVYILDLSNFNNKYLLKHQIYGYWRNGLIIVSNQNHYGIVDKYGVIKLDPEYDFIKYQYDYLNCTYSFVNAIVKKNGKEGYIDSTGKLISNIEYDIARPFHNNQACVFQSGKWGLINNFGKYVIMPDYQSISLLGFGSQDQINANSSKSGSLGEMLQKCAFSRELLHKKSDLRYLNKGDKFYYIDSNFKTVFTPQYYNCSDYFENLAIAQTKKNGKEYTCIDTKGNILYRMNADYISDYNNGVAIVQKNRKYKMIDKYGNVISELYDQIYNVSENLPYNSKLYVVQKGTLYGLIDNSGRIVCDVNFKNINILDSTNICLSNIQNEYIYNLGTNKLLLLPDKFEYVNQYFNKLIICKKFVYGRQFTYKIINAENGAIFADSLLQEPIFYGNVFQVVDKAQSKIIDFNGKIIWKKGM